MSRPATPNQIAKLLEYGYPTPQNFDHARSLLDQLAQSGWKRIEGNAPQQQGPPFHAPQPTGYAPQGQPQYGAPAAAPYQAPNNTYPNGQNDRPPQGGQTGQQRDPNSPATANQVKILVEKGYNPVGWTFTQASNKLDQLKQNGWQPIPGDTGAPPAAPVQGRPQGDQHPQQRYAQQGYQPNPPTYQQDSLPWGE